MTVDRDAWNPADHPRESGSGRFSDKSHSEPEEILGIGGQRQATALLIPVLDGVPYHQRVAEQDNPILAGYRAAQAQGVTAEEWADAIDAFFDDPETAPRGGVYDEVRELFGTPRDEADVRDWMTRTQAWRLETTATLAPGSAVPLAEVPSHSNDLGDWCPFSGEMHPGGSCPQLCEDGC